MSKSWVVENQSQTEHLGHYCTLSHSIRCEDGSFEIRQRILDTPEGYAKGRKRAALIALSPEMFEILDTLENDDDGIPAWLWSRIQKVIIV